MIWKTKKPLCTVYCIHTKKMHHLWGLSKLSTQHEVLKGKEVLP